MWIFEEQGRGRLDVNRLAVEILALVIVAGILAFVADAGRITMQRTRLASWHSIIVRTLLAVCIPLSLVSTVRVYQLDVERRAGFTRAEAAEHTLANQKEQLAAVGRSAKTVYPRIYSDVDDAELGLLVLQKYPGTCISPASLPPSFVLDPVPLKNPYRSEAPVP